MKKFVAIFLCMVLMATMIPSFFASAAAVPADGAATVVAADDKDGSRDTAGLGDTLKGFVELWGGLFKAILGSEVLEGFWPAIKAVIGVVSIGDFFSTIGKLWNDITKR